MNGDVRLVDGGGEDRGRVELCFGGEWGTVCGNFQWTVNVARVICRQLGYFNASRELERVDNRNAL